MYTFTPLMPHGAIDRVFTDIFFVTGTSRPVYMGQQWQFSRNMTIVRDGARLTLINTVRLDDAGLEALDGLGEVANVVKLGSFHGIDDAFYVDRYQAKLWALPGMEHESGRATDAELTVGGDTPFPGCSLFSFDTASQPEGVLLVDRDGGMLIACDSLQNWIEPDPYFSDESAKQMAEFGFFRAANIGPGWMRASQPQVSDFDRLMQLSFKHLLSAHGTPLRDRAHEQLAETIARTFKD